MKMTFKYICTGLLICIAMIACNSEELPPPTDVVVDSIRIVPSYNDARVVCRFYSNVTIDYARLYIDTDATFSKAVEVLLTKESSTLYSTTLTKLEDGQTYYVRIKISNVWSQVMVDQVFEFTTYPISAPVMAATELTDLTFNSATVKGEIIRSGGKIVNKRGIVYGVNSNPTLDNAARVFEIKDSSAALTCFLGGLEKNTVYYARTYAENEIGISYGDEVRFEVDTLWSGYDLGLSVKWAHVNIGANYPEEAGDYFAWAETEPKTRYTWSNYKFCNGSASSLTKYSSKVDSLSILLAQDDVARIKWGGKWRIPTIDEINELCEKCRWTWTEINGVGGYIVSSKRHNGSSIFLPLAGHMEGKNLIDYNITGSYWGSELLWDYIDVGILQLHPKHILGEADRFNTQRSHGLTVRAVCPK